MQAGSDKQQQKLNPSFLWEFLAAFSHAIPSASHWNWCMAKSLCLPSKAWPKLCVSGTKGRAVLTQSVTSLGRAFDGFISLYLHVLPLTKEESSCHCCKEKKGLESWVKHTKPYDLHVSGHVPGCNSGPEHAPCVWEELGFRYSPCTILTLSDCTNKNLPFHGSIV